MFQQHHKQMPGGVIYDNIDLPRRRERVCLNQVAFRIKTLGGSPDKGNEAMRMKANLAADRRLEYEQFSSGWKEDTGS
jgi:hypothetical protein